MIEIYPPKIRRVGSHSRLEASISLAGRRETLWYSVPDSYEQYFTSEVLDAFMVGLLPLAVREGWDVVLFAPCSERLLFRLEQDYIALLVALEPQRKPMRLIAKAGIMQSALPSAGAVALAFSAGVDSFFTLAEYSKVSVPKCYRPTHLVNSNVGAHGFDAATNARVFAQHAHQLAAAAAKASLPLLTIDSNLSDLLQMGFRTSHTPRNTSAVLCLQKLFGTFLYSGSYAYRSVTAHNANDIAFADPIGVPLLSTETTECVAAGSSFSRLEKVRFLRDYAPAQQHLNVCVKPTPDGANCSSCWKCARTLFDLEIVDGLSHFASLFDIRRYRMVRTQFLLWHVFAKRKYIVNQDLIRKAREAGVYMPWWLGPCGRFIELTRPRWGVLSWIKK